MNEWGATISLARYFARRYGGSPEEMLGASSRLRYDDAFLWYSCLLEEAESEKERNDCTSYQPNNSER